MSAPGGRTLLLASVALVAFAANSVICRLALRAGEIDAVSFTTLRVASGAAMLALLLALGGAPRRPRGDWPAALALYGYAIAFSIAYLALGAGTGALLLFGAVQLTMFGVGMARGERLSPRRWLGVALAAAGVAYLVWPGVSAPPLGSASLMLAAGVAWGIYSLRGRGSADPTADTAGNFLRAAPLALAVSLASLALGEPARLHASGVLYALLSGAIASGLGYAVWYTALRGLDATRAATVQLAVPVLAAAGGVALLGEVASTRLVVASIAVLGGIGLAVMRGAR